MTKQKLKDESVKKEFVIFLSALTLISCGSKKNDESPSAKNSEAFLVQNSMQPFLDTSSELRCDALKEFFTVFAAQKLNGANLAAYSCADNSGIGYMYSVKAQFTADGKSTVIIQHIWDSDALQTEYCDDFDGSSFATCGYEPFYIESATGTKFKGHLHQNLPTIREFVDEFISQKQNMDLAYGMDTKVFAEKWAAKFDGTHSHNLASASGPLSLWMKFEADKDNAKSGIAQITDANVGLFDVGKSFFNCKDIPCLKNREYTYKFTGHHLAIQTEAGDVLILSLPKPY